MNDFIAMDYEVFGNELFGNIPEDLYIAHKIDNTNRLFYGGNRGDYTSTLTIDENSKMMVIDVTSCTTVYHCTHHGGGICDHCSKCETTTCTTNSIPIFISEGTDFPTGNDIPPGGGGGIGIGDGEVPSGPGPKPPRDPCTKTGIFYRMMPGCGGTDIPELLDDPCALTKASITAANTVLKTPTVQSQMDTVLKGKRMLTNEWNTAIGINNNGSYDITPAIEQQQNSGSSPSDLLSNPSSFFADGHTHSGDPGKPSAGDLYGMLTEVFYNPNFKYRYVYGDSDMGTPEVYALVLNDRAAAMQFRDNYLESANYDPIKHGFLKDSDLWNAAEKVRVIYNKTSTINTSGEDYHSKAIAMAYILENLNAGISLAKVDNNGNLKKINVILEEITNLDGTKGLRANVSKCP